MKQKVLRANLFIGLGLIVFSVVLFCNLRSEASELELPRFACGAARTLAGLFFILRHGHPGA